jgi:hypothetical protein
MPSKKPQEKSEGPFLVVTDSNIVGGFKALTDGMSISYVTVYKTRAALDKFIKEASASKNVYNIFEGLSRVTFTHDAHFEAINGN